MASSGSTDFDQTRDEIITDALLNCGAIAEGDAPSAASMASAARQLNRMVKAWQTDGIHLWTRREAILFTSKSQGRYKLGPNSTDHAAELDDAAFTQLSADAASSASTITVDSVSNMAASDNIGIVLDDGTIQWTTIANIVSTTITLDDALTGDAAEDNAVFAYTTAIDRPLRILAAQQRDPDDLDTPLVDMSHFDYQVLPNKTITGRVNQFYYQPEIPDGFVHLWPEPDNANIRIRMTCLFPVEDFDVSSNTSDLPQEWLDALVWNLSYRLCPSYGTPPQTVQQIREHAAATRAAVSAWDREPVPLEIGVDFG